MDHPANSMPPQPLHVRAKLPLAMAGALLLFLTAPAAQAQTRRLLNHGAQGHVPSIVAHLTPVARLEATNRLRLEIGLPLHDQEKLQATLQALHDPANAQYHHWLTPEQFTESFGPTEQEYQSVVDYMAGHGLKVEAKYSNRGLVTVSGEVPKVEQAFGVKLRVYQHPQEKRTFYSADTVPSLDADVPVLGVSGLDNFEPPHAMDLVKKAQSFTNYTATGSGPGGLFMGKDFRAAYAPGVSLDGTGQFVALIDGQYFSNDPVLYAQDAGLPVPMITNIYVGGSPQGDPPPGTDDGEQSLDISMIMSMAPRATIMVYEGDADACFVQMALDNKAKQISCSLGWGPASPMLAQEFEEFDAQGQAFFAASGDGGSGGDASDSSGGGPGAANEYITLVGGTSLTTSGAGGPWQSETAWVGSGGAVCTNIPIPTYQQGISMAHNQGSTVYRNFPDVAMQADTDIFFIDDGNQGGVGGTSAAAPLFAGYMALVNQQAAAEGNPPVGFLNPPLYAVGKSASYTTVMHDITTGNNENSTYPTMFSAVSGYDLATGWGSPRGQGLINALVGTSPAPNFSLTVPSIINASVNDLTVRRGSNASITVSIIPGNGFDSSVNLSALDLPSGVTASFNPASATSTSTLTFTAGSTAPISPSPAAVTVVGTGGGLTRTVVFNLRVVAGTSGTADFGLTSAPSSVAVTPGGSSVSTITLNTINGFTNTVSLSASGLPAGVTAAFNPTSTTTGSALTFTADAVLATPGTNTVTITGTSGSLNHPVSVTLLVINPNQIVVPAIADGGFETPVLGAGIYEYDPSGAGWTFSGSAAITNGSGIVANSSAFSNPTAPEGVQAAFLQEYATISQAISGFMPGINYTINFAAAERSPGNHGGQSWNVMIDNTVVGSYQPGASATTYANYSASFTASATVHTLSFVGTDLGNSNNTVFLDNVTLAVSTNQLAAPVIALTAPANNATFTAPATVNLAANVATNGNAINSVQFYANSTLIGQATNAPYTYAWTNLSTGGYYVFAQVTYNGGSIADSAAINLTVTNTSDNLGFESPSVGSGIYVYNPAGASWNFSGVGLSGSGIVGNGSGLGNPNAPEGVQAAFIREQGTISQTFGGFTPGANYTITCSAAQRVGSAQSWNIMLDNTVLQINNGPGSTNYTPYTVNFAASAPVHTISFVGTDLAGSDNTIFLDNVTITPNENLGFETPSLGSGYEYYPAGASWTFSGASPSGSGLLANGSAFSNPNAPQGNQAAFVQEYGTISQPVSGLIPGTNYTILFQAAERPGNSQSWKVTVNGTSIATYNPGSGATAYTTYTASFTAAAATETLAFVGTDLGGGDNTVFIDNVQIISLPAGAPAAPTGLTAIPGNRQVSLSWNAVSGATSYNVESSTEIGGPYYTLATVTGTNFLNAGLFNGTTYDYVVSAVNASGAGANSSPANATPQVLPPATLTAIAANEQVNLSWSASTGAVSYLVESATASGGPYTVLANVGGTNYYNTGLRNGTTYYYVVWAMTSNGPTLGSTQASATPPGPALTTIGDFGFEVPYIGTANTNYQYGPAGSGWTFSGNSPFGSGIVGNGSAFSNPNAPEGIQAAFVQEYGTISQTISGFVPGTNYTIMFLAAERPGYAGESWKVTVNGTQVGSYNPGASATAYTAYKASFVATAASETVAFVGTDSAGGDNTVFIDDVQIGITGLTASPGPQVITNTLPVTAVDMVGSQVTFTAGIVAGEPIVYQWQMISGGATNNIPGATNTTLTLANLQLTNTAGYQLQASNAFGVVVSTPSSLTVGNVPPAVNNVVTSLASQTGTGSGTFAPTWTVTTNNSLIAGQSPSSTSGNFSLEAPGRSVNSLTAGGNNGLWQINGTSGTTTCTNYVTCGNGGGAGSSIIYTLAGSASGYDLMNIMVYGGWKDAGRDPQAYTVYYSTEAAPATFNLLGTVNFTPVNSAGAQCATRATLTPAAGVLATRVAAVKFDFTSPTTPNGYCGYSEINLLGVPSAQPVHWAVGNGNWDTSTLNWKLLSGGSAVSYVENNLAAFDDSASGSSPITVTLTGNHSPSVLTNNSTKNYVLGGNFAITSGSLIKSGTSTLLIDNGGANGFSSVLINNGTVQLGNNDSNGSLGTGNVTDNGTLTFERTDSITVTNLISGTGSLAQNGGGTVALGAANTYTGNTTVSAGTLALTEPGSIGGSALIAVASGATLDASGRADQTLTLTSGQTLTGSGSVKGVLNALTGSILSPGDTIGTLTVQGNITLNGAVFMELNRTNAQISSQLASISGTIAATGTLSVANVGPALQGGDLFQLFNQPVKGFTVATLPAVGAGYAWANNLALNGTLAVVSTAPPNLMSQVAGGNLLTLTWPSDQVGWHLQVQTNNPTVGLGTNWADVAGSTTNSQMSLPIDPNNGSVFYRLAYP